MIFFRFHTAHTTSIYEAFPLRMRERSEECYYRATPTDCLKPTPFNLSAMPTLRSV
jgi:hypothetical protein